MINSSKIVDELGPELEGELHVDNLFRIIYSTDASVYKEKPIGVVYPKSVKDIQQIVLFASKYQLALIPRAGGTSLAGQCVGHGLVVDVSRYMTNIISYHPAQQLIKVEPGIIRDQLNNFLKNDQLFFAPITSTANRATIGGMVGNNSCGTNSIVYGDTRQYVVSVKGILSDGSEVEFRELSKEEFQAKLNLQSLEGVLYRQIFQLLKDKRTQQQIVDGFPKRTVTRRNTGYALDELIRLQPFDPEGQRFNFSTLITGSEGTLAFITEISLKLCPLPPPEKIVVICQFADVQESLTAVKEVMSHHPFACELMDKIILDCTKDNLKYKYGRSFFSGDPESVLLVEFKAETLDAAVDLGELLIENLADKNLGYGYSIVKGNETSKIWELRSAGLGLMANIPGDKKAVACVEDTAVDVTDLADYIAEFDELMESFDQRVIHYAHAGAGELHLRPLLNLKTKVDQQKFYDISLASAQLVKKYMGSLSGEHGDGRVRAPFIPIVLGIENYKLLESIKTVWDPNNIFNPNKIVYPKKMNTDLRYEEDQETPELDTLIDFSGVGGMIRMAEKCNGSGDCRKLPFSGGTMCPSYQATLNEKHTTRARANALRSLLSESNTSNRFDHKELKEVLELCLSCKGCTSECPSNVDMSTLKAEFLYQYYKTHKTPLRSRIFANINRINALGAKMPSLTNYLFKSKLGGLIKRGLGIAAERSLPELSTISLINWYKTIFQSSTNSKQKAVYLFCDEFTNYNEAELGIKTVKLLDRLGYEVKFIDHDESGRAALSMGLLEKAKKHANRNVELFGDLVDQNTPLVGIEPSAILSFRDEYPKLVEQHLLADAERLAQNTLLIEEFLTKEIRAFNISSNSFDSTPRSIVVHGHCHQKALSDMASVFTMLSLPENTTVEILETGCCGMAGSFGYEKEHFEVSQQIGELRLFPAIRRLKDNQILVASGTSCRHQIKDGVAVKAYHPVEILFDALKEVK